MCDPYEGSVLGDNVNRASQSTMLSAGAPAFATSHDVHTDDAWPGLGHLSESGKLQPLQVCKQNRSSLSDAFCHQNSIAPNL